MGRPGRKGFKSAIIKTRKAHPEWTHEQIAEHVECSVVTVKRHLKETPEAASKRKGTPSSYDAVVKAYVGHENRSIGDIALITGYSGDTVRKDLDRHLKDTFNEEAGKKAWRERRESGPVRVNRIQAKTEPAINAEEPKQHEDIRCEEAATVLEESNPESMAESKPSTLVRLIEPQDSCYVLLGSNNEGRVPCKVFRDRLEAERFISPIQELYELLGRDGEFQLKEVPFYGDPSKSDCSEYYESLLSEAEQQVGETNAKHEDVLAELEIAKAKVSALEERNAELLNKLAALDREDSEVKALKMLPFRMNVVRTDNLEDALWLAQYVWPERLNFSAKAQKGAKKYSDAVGGKEGFKLLWSLAEILWELKFRSKDGQPLALSFKKRTGIELSMRESDTTRNNASMMDERKVTVGDTTYVCEAHLKGNKDLRIYFDFDEEDEKIIVGHCGKHLRTSETN